MTNSGNLQTITDAQRATIDAEVARWRADYPDNRVEVRVKPGTLMGGRDFDVEIPVAFLNINADTTPHTSFLAASIFPDGCWVTDNPKDWDRQVAS